MERQLVPPPSIFHVGLAASLGNHGLIKVLFETPSGFAIFSFDGWFGGENFVLLTNPSPLTPDAGIISHGLRHFLTKWCCPGYKLAAGKREYKTVIENALGIECMFNDAVMEVMWGLKNFIYSLVPEEILPLSREDRLQMSQGHKMLLNRYGFDVKPEMVSDNIIETACVLYDCDDTDKLLSKPLHEGGDILKDVSGIDTHGWSLMKLATALKMICCPGEKTVVGDPEEMFPKDVLSKLDKDAHKHKGKIRSGVVLRAYDELLASDRLRTATVKQLQSCVKLAEKAYQNEEVDALRSWGLLDLEPPSKRLRSHK